MVATDVYNFMQCVCDRRARLRRFICSIAGLRCAQDYELIRDARAMREAAEAEAEFSGGGGDDAASHRGGGGGDDGEPVAERSAQDIIAEQVAFGDVDSAKGRACLERLAEEEASRKT